MKSNTKLPQNKKEFAIFLVIVSVLSVNVIAPLITCFEIGFHLSVWAAALRVMPLIWVCVVCLVLLTYRPAAWLTARIVQPQDSFGAQILASTVCTVLLMSPVLTVLGAWIGSRQVSMEALQHFFYRWPRNFTISLAVEACIAQPLARLVLQRLHMRRTNAAQEPSSQL